MTIFEALDRVVDRTGHVRFRELCDPGHPDYNPAYIPLVISMAGGTPETPDASPRIPTVADQIDMIGRMKACKFWVKAQCGCDANICSAGRGIGGRVTHADCFACLAGSEDGYPGASGRR